MAHTIVTMTRGDAHKIGEWIEYHSRLGFDDFQLILDGDVDDTREVVESLDAPAIAVHPRDEVGEYSEGLTQAERLAQTEAWRERHRADLEAHRMRGVDPLSWRQQMHFPGVLAPYAAGERGKGWLSLLDVDEFVVVRGPATIREVTRSAQAPRIRLRSLDVDTTGHDPGRPVLPQHSMRWAHEDLVALKDPRWARRSKSLVRYRCARLTSTVHKISLGPKQIADPDVARIHHFRVPLQTGVPVPYRVYDPIRMPE